MGLLVFLYRILGPRAFTGSIVDALAGRGAARMSPSAAAAVSDAFHRGNKRGKYWAMRSVMLHRPDLRPVLSRLQVPTLMLAARDDSLNDPEEAERAARTVPDGHFARVSGGGHVAPLLIAPAEVAQHVLTFWSAKRNRQSAA